MAKRTYYIWLSDTWDASQDASGSALQLLIDLAPEGRKHLADSPEEAYLLDAVKTAHIDFSSELWLVEKERADTALGSHDDWNWQAEAVVVRLTKGKPVLALLVAHDSPLKQEAAKLYRQAKTELINQYKLRRAIRHPDQARGMFPDASDGELKEMFPWLNQGPTKSKWNPRRGKW